MEAGWSTHGLRSIRTRRGRPTCPLQRPILTPVHCAAARPHGYNGATPEKQPSQSGPAARPQRDHHQAGRATYRRASSALHPSQSLQIRATADLRPSGSGAAVTQSSALHGRPLRALLAAESAPSNGPPRRLARHCDVISCRMSSNLSPARRHQHGLHLLAFVFASPPLFLPLSLCVSVCLSSGVSTALGLLCLPVSVSVKASVSAYHS